MSVSITFYPKGGIKAYEAGVRQLEAQDEKVQLHRSAHYASGTDEDFQVVDIWDSEADFNNFATVLVPILNKTGLDAGIPEIRRIVNTIDPGVALLDDIGIEAWNAHDPNGWVELFADDFTLSDSNLPDVITTKDGARGYIQSWLTAFPDMQVRQLDRVVSGSRVAGFIEFTGTNTGPLTSSTGEQLAATGRQVVGSGSYIATVNDRGQIKSFTVWPDVVGMLLQLGVDLTNLG